MKFNLSTLVLLAGIIVLLPTDSNAQWIRANGPYGGIVNAFAGNDSNIIVGTSGRGAFLSTDGGGTWTPINNGLTNSAVRALIIKDSNIFAGTSGTGVYRSSNGGASWTEMNNGFEPTANDVRSFAIVGSNIFAGTVNGGVYRSSDDGNTWSVVNTGLNNTDVRALAVIGSNIFAATFGDGIFLSTNNGTNWTLVNNGLFDLYVTSFAVNDTMLFAGTISGIFLSRDNGSTWTQTEITNVMVQAMASDGAYIYAGAYLTGVFVYNTGSGTHWIQSNAGLTTADVTAMAVINGTIFAGTWGGGIFCSINHGMGWDQSNTGLGIETKAIAVRGKTVFAGTWGAGVFHSSDNGNTWAQNIFGLMNTYVSDLAICPASGGTSDTNILAGTFGGVYRSSDNGSTWAWASNGLTSSLILSFANIGSNVFVGTEGGGVFLSTNDGTDWVPKNTGLTNLSVHALAVDGLNLYAGTYGDGVFLSTDNGDSWTQTGLTGTWVNDLAVIPTPLQIGGNHIFAGTNDNGVYVSITNGTTWTQVNTGLSNTIVTALAVIDLNLFAGTYGGVFFTTNMGETWIEVNTGLTSLMTKALVISGSNIFAGTDTCIFVRPLSDLITSIKTVTQSELPGRFALAQNYPNPFNPATTISFSLPSKSFVSLKIFDALGREAATIVSEELSTGNYSRQWNAIGMPSGVYFYRLSVVPLARPASPSASASSSTTIVGRDGKRGERDLVPTNSRNGQAGSFTETKKLVLLR